MDKKVCTRCLLRDFDKATYMNNLYEQIKNIEEDIRTHKDVYDKRLEECKKCGYLLEGMCRACGCYVELRAAIKDNECPYEKW